MTVQFSPQRKKKGMNSERVKTSEALDFVFRTVKYLQVLVFIHFWVTNIVTLEFSCRLRINHGEKNKIKETKQLH